MRSPKVLKEVSFYFVQGVDSDVIEILVKNVDAVGTSYHHFRPTEFATDCLRGEGFVVVDEIKPLGSCESLVHTIQDT